jgi:hypothetical protein
MIKVLDKKAKNQYMLKVLGEEYD